MTIIKMKMKELHSSMKPKRRLRGATRTNSLSLVLSWRWSPSKWHTTWSMPSVSKLSSLFLWVSWLRWRVQLRTLPRGPRTSRPLWLNGKHSWKILFERSLTSTSFSELPKSMQLKILCSQTCSTSWFRYSLHWKYYQAVWCKIGVKKQKRV